MAYDYLSSQPLYHYFSDPAIRESIMMIPKAVTIVGLLLNILFLAIVLFYTWRQQKDLEVEKEPI